MEDAMENGGLVSIQNAIDANRGIWNLSIFVFFGGTALLSLYIKKVNNFSYLETLLVALGFKRFKRNWKINLSIFLIIFISLALGSQALSGN